MARDRPVSGERRAPSAGAEQTTPVDVLLSFGAALLSLRLAGLLLREGTHRVGRRPRSRSPPRPARWPGAPRTAGMRASFRVYYLAGALLSAPLLGDRLAAALGHGAGRRRSASSTPGVAVGSRSSDAGARTVRRRRAVPRAQDHVDALARVVAIAGSSLGALAVVVVAVATLRRRPLGNALIVASVAAAAAASALTQTAVSAAAACFAAAALLLYAGVRA